MKSLAILLQVFFFAATLVNSSMFMLSIEKGHVYTENFNLSHIVQQSNARQDRAAAPRQHGVDPCRNLCHLHVLISKIFIPESQDVSGLVESTSECESFTAFNPGSGTFLPVTFSRTKRYVLSKNTRQVPLQLQSSVLLI